MIGKIRVTRYLSLVGILALFACDGGRGRIAAPPSGLRQPVVRKALAPAPPAAPMSNASSLRRDPNPGVMPKDRLCRNRGIRFANGRAGLSYREQIYYFSALEHSQSTPVDWRLMAALAYTESGFDAEAPNGLFGFGNDICTEEEMKSLGLKAKEKNQSVEWGICSGIRNYKKFHQAMRFPQRRGTYLPSEEDLNRLAIAAYRLGLDEMIEVQEMSDQPLSWVSVCRNLPEEQIIQVLQVMGQYEYYKSQPLYLGVATTAASTGGGDTPSPDPTIPPTDPDPTVPPSEPDPDVTTPPDQPDVGDVVDITMPYFDPGDSPEQFDITIPKGATEKAPSGKRIVDIIAEEAKEARNTDTNLYPNEGDETMDLGLDWRLILAIAWQQSDLDPDEEEFIPSGSKRSPEEAALGLMQIIPSTGKILGIEKENLKDIRLNVRGGVQFYRWILSYLHANEEHVYIKNHRRSVPYTSEKSYPLYSTSSVDDRFKLAFAAYLGGPAHLSDVQEYAISKRLDPRNWNNLRTIFPKLQTKEFCEKNQITFGVCQGESIVRGVESLLGRGGKYETLLRTYPVRGHEEMSDRIRDEAQEALGDS